MEKEVQRWSAKRKAELIVELIKGTKKLVDVCREYDLKQSEVEDWMDSFLKATSFLSRSCVDGLGCQDRRSTTGRMRNSAHRDHSFRLHVITENPS